MLTTIWKTQAISTRLQALISGFLANARGNVAVITALAALPIVSAIGCAVDYSMATTIKTKLQAAADAATLAAVSANSPLVATAKTMTGNGAVSNGATYTQNFFDSNLSSSPANAGYNSPSRTASVTKSGATITATLVERRQQHDQKHRHDDGEFDRSDPRRRPSPSRKSSRRPPRKRR